MKLKSNWGAIAFPKDYSKRRNHFSEERQIPVTPSKYVHVRLKFSINRSATNPQYIFNAFDLIERSVTGLVHLAERKEFQSELNVDQLVNHNNVKKMISGK